MIAAMPGRATTLIASAAAAIAVVGCGGSGGETAKSPSGPSGAASASAASGGSNAQRSSAARESLPGGSDGTSRGGAGAAESESPKAPSAPPGVGRSGKKKADGVQRILEKITRPTAGQKQGRSRHILEQILAKARKEGIEVVGSAGGSGGETAGAVEKILGQLGSKSP
jgi:hypothetical protein